MRPPGVPKTVPKPPPNAAYRLISMLECAAQDQWTDGFRENHRKIWNIDMKDTWNIMKLTEKRCGNHRNVGFQDLPGLGSNLNPS
jgi:hypothetical protein